MKNSALETMMAEATEKLMSSRKMLDDLFTVAYDKDLDPSIPADQQRILRLWPVVAEMVNAAFCDLDDYIRLIHEMEFESDAETENAQEVNV